MDGQGFALTITQRKGGVGRSTMLFNLAGAMAKRGMKVCIVDLDPQASITQLCMNPEAVDLMPPARTVVGLMGDNFLGSALDLVQVTDIPGVSIIPGSNSLAKFNFPEPEKTGDLQDALKEAVQDLKPAYDAILFDTPPSLETLSWLPAVAADVAITPTQAEPLAVQELTHAARFLDRVRWARNPRLSWLGVVLTMHQPKLAIHAAYEKQMRDAYGALMLSSAIPYNVAFKEVAVARSPLAFYKPKGAPAKAIEALTTEILGRVAMVRGGGSVGGEVAA